MRGLFLLGSVLLLVFLVWPIVRRFLPLSAGRQRAIRDELVKDPVCQTYVLRSRALRREAGGTTHYFCSRECAARFSP
jgi:YHS domain-containing protein